MATAAVTKMAIANGLRSAWHIRNAQSHNATIVSATNDTVARMTGGLSRVRWKDRLNHIRVVMASKAQTPATTAAKRNISTRLLVVMVLFLEPFGYSLAGIVIDHQGSLLVKAPRFTLSISSTDASR